MSKRNLSITIGIVAALAVTGVASGAAVKITDFARYNEANAEDSQADGMAILRHVTGQDNTVAQIILSGLDPEQTYVVVLRHTQPWCLNADAEAGAEVVFVPETDGSFFFPLSAENQQPDSKGHLTLHDSTESGSGNFSDSDVLVFLQCDWNDANLAVGIRVQLIGDKETPPLACPLP